MTNKEADNLFSDLSNAIGTHVFHREAQALRKKLTRLCEIKYTLGKQHGKEEQQKEQEQKEITSEEVADSLLGSDARQTGVG